MLKVEFEGTDGAGKTTGLKYFIEKAQERGLKVVEAREVGNPHIASCVKMREFVLDPANNLRGESMELIFSAMRLENDQWLTDLEARTNGPDLVVSDRGWFSHLAYTDHNVSPKFTQDLYEGLIGRRTKMPDVVIYFDVNTDTALKRRVSRGGATDVIEMKGVAFQDKVRESFQNYIHEAHETTNVRFFTVDANESLDVVKARLDAILSELAQ